MLGLVLLTVGCHKQASQRVVLYCSQDREYAVGLLAEFTKTTGIQVEIRSDTEANKTVGLYESIVRESSQPRCDVFWCNEPVLMQRLAQKQLLQPYVSSSAKDYPSWTRPAGNYWQAFAARARVLVVHERIAELDTPKTLQELLQPWWNKRWGMAKPFFGTTATHMACLWQRLGSEPTQKLMEQMAQSAVILPGNKDVAVAVGDGQIDMGLTDTDDAVVVQNMKKPVRMVYLDQTTTGTLFLPNTLGLIKNAPHADTGKKLIDYLLSELVERQLALGPSAQIPLNPKVVLDKPRIQTLTTVNAMEVDYKAVANHWDEVQAFLRKTFRD
ncbi:MAG: extracellular solute-binding protein [Planctomycetia bacterium]|nr:extracellular solute-binding protein [Planctomycetia bacterium]